MLYDWLISGLWLVFLGYWIISARSMKKIVRQGNPWRGLGILVAFVVLFLLQEYVFHFDFIPHTSVIEIIGVVLCGAGIAFAIWARRHLGRNWNARPSIQEGHELVTSGPYALVRHPIYTGVILAVLGSVLVGDTVWLIVFILFCGELVWRIHIEDRLMMREFPDTYPEYKKRTKMIIPFIL